MSIDERIESTWRQRETYHAVTTAPLHGDIAAIAKVEFSAGYRAALQDLYVEVKPKDVKPNRAYDFRYQGKWYSTETTFGCGILWRVGKTQISPSVCDLIVTENFLPSPSEVFGEEVG